MPSGRPDYGSVSAVVRDRIFEVKSTYILQPGPASLTEGVTRLYATLMNLQTG